MEHRNLQVHEHDKFRLDEYKSATLYKKKIKKIHGKHI